ncbi:MAG: phosphoribosylglycinamide formyltransferase [Gammaproteobacteria bacterium]
MNAAAPRVVVLGSGVGSNFEALAEQAAGRYCIVAVGSDRPAALILNRARERGISTFVLRPADYSDRAGHDAALAAALAAAEPDWIALAGYLRFLGAETLARWPGRILNVHPSLLPAFPGLDTHRRALAAGARRHGATVHFVTTALDAGPRIVQARLGINPAETPESLRCRVHALEHRIYPRALTWCAAGRMRMEAEAAWFDGAPLREPVVIEENDP